MMPMRPKKLPKHLLHVATCKCRLGHIPMHAQRRRYQPYHTIPTNPIWQSRRANGTQPTSAQSHGRAGHIMMVVKHALPHTSAPDDCASGKVPHPPT